MPKRGEIDYLSNLDSAGVLHAVHKPFSDPGRARYLAEMAAVLALLPPPPARLLDLGCGTGWTSVFFARAGYEVVGVDLAPDMIDHAEANRDRDRAGADSLRFLVCDYEDLPFDADFDAAVFYDSLHHAVDEEAALCGAFRALRPGGVCIASEPGAGHHLSPEARAAVERYNVTEKEMPPEYVAALGRRIGFREARVYPHAFDLHQSLYQSDPDAAAPPTRWPRWLKSLLYWPVAQMLRVGRGPFTSRLGAVGYLRQVAHLLGQAQRLGGITVLVK
jgi:SAM-dependent methyltransferase